MGAALGFYAGVWEGRGWSGGWERWGVPGPGPEHPHGNLLETAAAAVSWIILHPLETPLGWGELTSRRVVDPSGKPHSPPI